MGSLTRAVVAALALGLLWLPSPGSAAGEAKPLPAVKPAGAGFAFSVDGKPWILLAGEVHNSTASNAAYMAPVWDRLKEQNLNTVVTPAYWEMVEPEEGRFDFELVDEQIRQARARGLRIVLIWFGTLKNAQSSYAPAWVRSDERRFPRAATHEKRRSALHGEPPISVFGEAVAAADARAFSRLMAHLAAVDGEHTVIAVQVENETGLLGDSRDRSPVAEAVWRSPVPAALISHLKRYRGRLDPALESVWRRGGYREAGSWSEVFGDDWQGEEVFMAWGVARFVDRVARAGKSELALPMYANAWIGPQGPADIAGDYPAGGPVPRVLQVWQGGAPSLDWISPDIYGGDFDAWARAYARPDNPLFIPETRFVLGNLFTALGNHRAIGFSPFGIEDGVADNQIADAYAQLRGMTGIVAQAQAKASLMGVALEPGKTIEFSLGDYVLTVRSARDAKRSALLDIGVRLPEDPPESARQNEGNGIPDMTDPRASGLVIQIAPNEFVVVGKDLDLKFRRKNDPREVEIARFEEGRYLDGAWVPGRVLNGDERLGVLPSDRVGVVRISLLARRPS